MHAFLRTIRAGIRLIRMYQWSKNGLVFVPLVFSQELLNPTAFGRAVLAGLSFCLASGAGYVFNDILDRKQDRNHPVKQHRPLARGDIGLPAAWIEMAVLLVAAFLPALALPRRFALTLLIYLGLTFAYSLFLKRIFLLDVIAVALGFVLRAVAGAVALPVVFSTWLVVCTFFLALLLALGKRRGEIIRPKNPAGPARPVLCTYTKEFIDQLLVVMAGSALITFTIYTCNAEVAARLETDMLYLTLPFVVYGLGRYLWLARQNQAEDPSQILLKDRPTGVTVLLWALACTLILYA